MPRRPAEGARDHILDTAARLFDAHGVHSVGLQQIVDACGCGKNLLYREFASKDELVLAYMQRCDGRWTETFESAVAPHAGDPGAQLVAVVRAVADEATASGTRGCALRNTLAEFPDPEHPVHRLAVAHFSRVRAQLRGLAEETGTADPGTLADRIMLIIDGLYANGATLGADGAACVAIRFAEDVVGVASR